MRSLAAFALLTPGALLLACAQGSAIQLDDRAASLDPAHPAGVDGGPVVAEPSDAALEARPDDAAGGPEADAAVATFVNGAAAGVTIAPAHAGAVLVAAGGSVERLVIPLTTRAGFCADYANGVDHAGEHTLVLVVIAKGTSSVGPGTYTVGTGAPSSVGGSFDTSARILSYDAQCKTTVAAAKEYAAAGSITVLQVAGAAVTATFSLTFPGSTAIVSGSLSAAVCTAHGADSFACVP
ncbi:MAG TPA: hypothetical protein VLT33_41530 [Labilithrix sp.]|nr:hypothetical protein [Labilithrix sp.]